MLNDIVPLECWLPACLRNVSQLPLVFTTALYTVSKTEWQPLGLFLTVLEQANHVQQLQGKIGPSASSSSGIRSRQLLTPQGQRGDNTGGRHTVSR